MRLSYAPIQWRDGSLYMLDQRKLPLEEVYEVANSLEDIFGAIQNMVVRGAPLIGFTGIFGIYFWTKDHFSTKESLEKASEYLKSSRPTAINLAFEVDNVVRIVIEALDGQKSQHEACQNILKFAERQIEKIRLDNQKMADLAAEHLKTLYGERALNIMTLCNTGFLACGPMGTALGVISNLKKLNRLNKVYVSETRPYLQGTRLTSYELNKEKIEHRIVTEGASSYVLSNKKIDAIFIGADRIVKNGDTANKIGSSSLSIIANYYHIPFFVVAPTSSFDLTLGHGDEIEIEFRSEDEVLKYGHLQVAPLESRALNPSFDITANRNIRAIFCEKGEIFPVSQNKVINTLRS